MDERFARVVRLELAEHLDPVRGDHPAWASSPAAAAVASSARQQAGPGRYWLLIAAAIAAVTLATTILLAGGFRLPDLPSLPWLLSESPTPTMPDASPEPTPTPDASPEPTPTADADVFSWSRDDLSEWVTEAELTEAIAAMATRGTFPAPLDGAVTLGGFVGQQVSFRLVGDAEPWRLSISPGVTAYVGPPTTTDPRLPDGVTYEAECWRCYGDYILSGPYSDELLAITLFPPGVHSWRDVDVSDAAYKARVFALASTMLIEMGWAEETAADPNVFSWARDDPSEWVTEAELTEAIAAMSMQRPFEADLDGTVETCAAENTGRDGQECWTFRLAGGTESWRIFVHNGDHDGDGNPESPGRVRALRGGVTFAEVWPGFVFSGPNSNESICIVLVPSGGISQLEWQSVGYRGRVFDLGYMMLRELGWAD